MDLPQWGCLGLRYARKSPGGIGLQVLHTVLTSASFCFELFITSLKFCFLVYLEKRIPFLNVLEITLTDFLKFEILSEVLNQGA